MNIGSLFSQQEGQDDFDDAPSGKDGAVKRPACPTYSTHEEAVGNLWLDVCMNPDSVSEASDSGGLSGLLFVFVSYLSLNWEWGCEI